MKKETMSLIKHNVEEIVSEDAFDSLLKKKKNPVVYCGYEPSGPVHLGHFVTITKLIDLQKAGFEVKILLADIHAQLNRKGDSQLIQKEVVAWKKTISAIGLTAEVILGSSFQYKKEYQADVMTLAQATSINRGLRSMQEIARDIKNASISQLWYPLMQVADIKYLKTDVALGGMEQRKVHMVGKDLGKVLNYDFIAFHTPLITSLKGPGEKMSKSIPGSGISVTDSLDEIKRTLKNAYCPAKDESDNPVLQIVKLIIFPHKKEMHVQRPDKFGGDVLYNSYEELEKDYTSGNLHPADLKTCLVSYLEEIIAPIRKNFK